MIKSETIGKLTEALSKMQAVLEGAKMDGENPFFRSKYSTLASVWDACRKLLSDNGLAIFQTAAFIPEHPEMVAIETTLSHSSGEFVTGLMAAKPVKADPQSVGSCVTYLRRYSLAAICGVSPEDDDGNAATGKVESTNKHVKVQPVQSSGEKSIVNDDDHGTNCADDIVFAKIKSIGSKDGATNGKPWKVYFIETATDKYATFDTKIADFANTLVSSGELARLQWKQGKRGKEVVALSI